VDLQIRPLERRDAEPMAAAFAAIGWKKTLSQYVGYLVAQGEGRRDVLVAFIDRTFAGYVTIVWESSYEPFRSAHVPEISDLNVLPAFRRRGIATQLLDHAETRIAERADVAGIGVGMTTDYGPAQRLYVLRGYVPDGLGLASHDRIVQYGDQIRVDDDLVLWFTKSVR
jgi:ribosomal protein S18 acetylase RimI-like enzyme